MLYTELMGQPGVIGAISNKLEEFGIKKSEKQVTHIINYSNSNQ
jgi:hypothetical protein